jgi:uncharacterized protein with FMN-binding domain
MEPENKSKNIGIVLGVVVVLAVIAAVVFGNRQSDTSTATTDQTSSQATDTSSAPTTSVDSTTVATPPVDTTPVADTTTTTTVVAQTPPPVVIKKPTSVYKDGTYTATGSYMSPGGPDQVGVTLTLANDVITSISVTPGAGDNESARYQNRFISGYKPLVIGKNIATVNLSRVSGSSLTSRGFNAALAKIETQAKA